MPIVLAIWNVCISALNDNQQYVRTCYNNGFPRTWMYVIRVYRPDNCIKFQITTCCFNKAMTAVTWILLCLWFLFEASNKSYMRWKRAVIFRNPQLSLIPMFNSNGIWFWSFWCNSSMKSPPARHATNYRFGSLTCFQQFWVDLCNCFLWNANTWCCR